MMRKRWVWGSFVHELEHNFCGISSEQEMSIVDRKGSLGTHFLGMAN